MSRLKDMYKEQIVDAMIKKFGYKNVMEVPKLDKIVVNMGVGEAKDNAKTLETAAAELETITVRRLLQQKLRRPLLTSRSEKACPSDVKLLSVAKKCMSSWIVL